MQWQTSSYSKRKSESLYSAGKPTLTITQICRKCKAFKRMFSPLFFSGYKLHHFFLEIAVVSSGLFQYWSSMQGGSVSPTSALRPFLHCVQHSIHFTPWWNLPPISVKALYFPLSSPRPCFAIYHFALLSGLASFQSACIYPSQYESDLCSGPLFVRRWHHLNSLHALIS